MRSLKTSAGLPRGRGMTEIQRLIWLMSMPACAEINLAIQELNSVNFTTSEQHKDLSKSRQDRDTKDTALGVSYFEDRNPFVNGEHLMNIADGVIAASNLNVDQAKSIEEMIMQSMMGKNA